ncbi:unnamed protein product [Ambrosiozyma monospora]|uniref:Unnamed protein product n=1 Tax=Ambrosiozyma monospora TaxID=43982 RepID=A0A9W6Z5Z6_AMBMO|nr:unnamed protein product [Ambrosiozyma monospora]
MDSVLGLGLFEDELPTMLTFNVPESFHRQIIGVGGQTVQTIMRKFNVFIKFSNSFEMSDKTLDEMHSNQATNYQQSFIRKNNVVIKCPAKNKSQIPVAKLELEKLVEKVTLNSYNCTIINLNYAQWKLLTSWQLNKFFNLNRRKPTNFITELEKMTNTYIKFPRLDEVDGGVASVEGIPLEIYGVDNNSKTCAAELNKYVPYEYEFTLSKSSLFKQLINVSTSPSSNSNSSSSYSSSGSNQGSRSSSGSGSPLNRSSSLSRRQSQSRRQSSQQHQRSPTGPTHHGQNQNQYGTEQQLAPLQEKFLSTILVPLKLLFNIEIQLKSTSKADHIILNYYPTSFDYDSNSNSNSNSSSPSSSSNNTSHQQQQQQFQITSDRLSEQKQQKIVSSDKFQTILLTVTQFLKDNSFILISKNIKPCSYVTHTKESLLLQQQQQAQAQAAQQQQQQAQLQLQSLGGAGGSRNGSSDGLSACSTATNSPFLQSSMLVVVPCLVVVLVPLAQLHLPVVLLVWVDCLV